jgi:hypothetical protein
MNVYTNVSPKIEKLNDHSIFVRSGVGVVLLKNDVAKLHSYK